MRKIVASSGSTVRSLELQDVAKPASQTTSSTESSYSVGASKLHKARGQGTVSTIMGSMKKGVATVALAAMLVGMPGVSLAQMNAAHEIPEPIATEHVVDQSASTSAFKEAFDAGLREGKDQRELAAKLGMAPGQLLVSSDIPIVRNIGETVKKAGQAVSSPFTILAGIFTLNGDRIKNGFEDLGRGTLGVVGLEEVVMGEYDKPGGNITGELSLPADYAASIRAAKSEWRNYSTEEKNRDYQHGMKKWHTLSNAKLASNASIGELPWIFLGGIAHELDPGGVSDEISGQGFASWLVDSPLDIVANTLGMVGGLLLPDDAHQEYARIVGNIVPGPYDPFEQGGAAEHGSGTASATHSVDGDESK